MNGKKNATFGNLMTFIARWEVTQLVQWMDGGKAVAHFNQ